MQSNLCGKKYISDRSVSFFRITQIFLLATGDCVWTRQNTDIYALFAKFDFARTTKYEQSRLRQKSSKIAAFWLIVEKNPC